MSCVIIMIHIYKIHKMKKSNESKSIKAFPWIPLSNNFGVGQRYVKKHKFWDADVNTWFDMHSLTIVGTSGHKSNSKNLHFLRPLNRLEFGRFMWWLYFIWAGNINFSAGPLACTFKELSKIYPGKNATVRAWKSEQGKWQSLNRHDFCSVSHSSLGNSLCQWEQSSVPKA